MGKFARALLEGGELGRYWKVGSSNFQLRQFCSSKRKESGFTVENLKNRSLILVSGRGASDLLQKLTTNDISKLDDSRHKGIFSLFLNDKGRVLHDAIIYKSGDDYLVEVENKAMQPVKIHLKLFKRGRDVEVKNLEGKLTVWSVLSNNENEADRLKDIEMGSEWIACIDPRLEALGLRIIGPRRRDVISALKNTGLPVVNTRQRWYQLLRYKLGIAEGLTEISLGRCNPKEINADYLSGMCNKKTNFMGCNVFEQSIPFIRRVFPLYFSNDVEDSVPLNTPIQDQKGRKKSPIGYLCGLKRNVGLGLIAVDEILGDANVRLINEHKLIFAHCAKPSWWPEQTSQRKSVTQPDIT